MGGFYVTSLGSLYMEGLIFGILWSSTHLRRFILFSHVFALFEFKYFTPKI